MALELLKDPWIISASMKSRDGEINFTKRRKEMKQYKDTTLDLHWKHPKMDLPEDETQPTTETGPTTTETEPPIINLQPLTSCTKPPPTKNKPANRVHLLCPICGVNTKGRLLQHLGLAHNKTKEEKIRLNNEARKAFFDSQATNAKIVSEEVVKTFLEAYCENKKVKKGETQSTKWRKHAQIQNTQPPTIKTEPTTIETEPPIINLQPSTSGTKPPPTRNKSPNRVHILCPICGKSTGGKLPHHLAQVHNKTKEERIRLNKKARKAFFDSQTPKAKIVSEEIVKRFLGAHYENKKVKKGVLGLLNCLGVEVTIKYM